MRLSWNLMACVGFFLLAGCAKHVQIPEQSTYTQPSWYAECEQQGSEGLLWWSGGYVYACGMGVSRFEQAAEAQANSFAINSYAERLNSAVESRTDINITEKTKESQTSITHAVPRTAIRNQLEAERSTYRFDGNYHVFIKLKMSVEDYEQLKQGAKDAETTDLSSGRRSNRMLCGKAA